MLRKRFSGVMALLAGVVLVFGLVGCSDPAGSGGGTSLDKALIAKWYIYPTEVDKPNANHAFEITADGRLTGDAINGEIKVTTSGGKITAAMNGQTLGTAEYKVTGNRLLLSNPTLNGATGGIFLSLVTAIQTAQSMGSTLGADGHYHKSSTGGGGNTGMTLVMTNLSPYNGQNARVNIYQGDQMVARSRASAVVSNNSVTLILEDLSGRLWTGAGTCKFVVSLTGTQGTTTLTTTREIPPGATSFTIQWSFYEG